QVLEHALPWLLNTVIAWVNDGVAEENRLCPELPAYIRFGVNRPISLELARGGVRSRRLAHVVAASAEASTIEPVRDWLIESDVRSWAQLFNASPSELADLLFFTRARDVHITSRVLAGEAVDLPLQLHGSASVASIYLRPAEEDRPPRLAAFAG